MIIKKLLFGSSLAVLFVAGLVLGGYASAQVADPVDGDVLPVSGRWTFITKIDQKCVDSGDMDYCDPNHPDDTCKLGIKKDSDGNILEKKCQN